MVSEKSPDELPSGWKEHVKVSNGRKIKYYTNEVRGLKFYSKKRVIQFVHSEDACQDTSQSVNDQKSSSSKTEASPVVVEENESPEWLPQGWTIETRTRKSGANAGSVYKIYTDPLTGHKFYSKPQVMRYLERVNCDAAPEKQHKETSGVNSSKQDAPFHCEFIEGKNQISGKEENGIGKPTLVEEVNRDNTSKENTPIQCQSVKGKGHISGKEENGMGNPSLEEVSRDNSSKQDSPQQCKTTSGRNHISGKEDNGMGKPSLEIAGSVMDESNVPDELPPGWLKEIRVRKQGTRKDPFYIDPVSGYEFRSKKDVLRYLESGDISRCAITPKKRDRSDLKQAEYDVSAQPDGKKLGRAQAGKQPFVGQTSEEDGGSSLRTILAVPEPERSRTVRGDNKSTDVKVSTSTPDVVQDMQLASAKIKCHGTQESHQPKTDCSKLELKAVFSTTAVLHEQKHPEAERSKETPSCNTSNDAKVIPSTVDLSDVLEICSELNNCYKSADSSQSKTEGSELYVEDDDTGALSNTATAVLHDQKDPEDCVDTDTQTQLKRSKNEKPLRMPVRSSKRLSGQGPEILPNLGSSATAVLHEEKRPEDSVDQKTQIQLKSSKKRKPPSTPARSSKRLSGKEPEILPDLGLSERALRATVKKPGQTEAYVTSSLVQDSTANGLQQQSDTGTPGEVVADFTTPCKEASLETEIQNIEKPSEDQVVREEAVGQVNEREEAVGQVNERPEEENPRSRDSQFCYPFGDSFSDPCYEFAFKTLTGEIPFEDALTFPGCFQQQIETSFTQRDASFEVSEIDTPALFQNDVSFHFDSAQQNASTDQAPSESNIPPRNINLPSCSSFGSQQPSLEARNKDYETKVKS